MVFLLDPADCRHPDDVLNYLGEWPEVDPPSLHECTACGTSVQRPCPVGPNAPGGALASLIALNDAAVAHA